MSSVTAPASCDFLDAFPTSKHFHVAKPFRVLKEVKNLIRSSHKAQQTTDMTRQISLKALWDGRSQSQRTNGCHLCDALERQNESMLTEIRDVVSFPRNTCHGMCTRVHKCSNVWVCECLLVLIASLIAPGSPFYVSQVQGLHHHTHPALRGF